MINPLEQLVNGAINLGINERYENLNGEGVITANIENLVPHFFYLNIGNSSFSDKNYNSEEDTESSLLWRVLLRHPNEVPKEFAIPGLYEEAIQFIFSESEESLGFLSVMGV